MVRSTIVSRRCSSGLFTIAVLIFVGPAMSKFPIKNVVTIMMENHSFDNLLGWLKGVGDLTGKEFNLVNASNPLSRKVYVSEAKRYCTTPDPAHDFLSTATQVFSPNTYPTTNNESYHPTMGGFVEDYIRIKGDPDTIMQCYTPSQVPVISALASEFAVGTRWFASLAGPTGPNRMFLHAATTLGYNGGNYANYPLNATSIYEQLQEAGFTWAIHWNDFTTAHGIHPLNTYTTNFVHDLNFTAFYKSLKEETLPNYTVLVPLLNPHGELKPTSQHPSYDIRPGEAQLKAVYEALRASTYWDDTLLLVIYDEHGGFWDSKLPPSGFPNPSPSTPSHPYPDYTFPNLGVRTPAVFVSPFVKKGVVDETIYDHTSVAATLRKIFQLESSPLSPREAAANTFGHLFADTKRTNTPTSLPQVPKNPAYCAYELETGPRFGLQDENVDMYHQLLSARGMQCSTSVEPSMILTDREVGQYCIEAAQCLFGSTSPSQLT